MSTSAARDPKKAVEKRRQSLLLHFRPSRTSSEEQPENVPGFTNTHSNSSFMQLPPELRNLIYEYAFTLSTEERLRIAHFDPILQGASGLLLTCKQIRHEISDLPYLSAVTIVWPYHNRTRWREYSKSNMISSDGLVVRNRPGTIKYLASGFRLFRSSSSTNDSLKSTINPLDDLIDTAVIKQNGVEPKEFILKICICDAVNWLSNDPGAIMSFCIALERLVMHFPSLKRIIIYYCTKKWPSWLNERGFVDFPLIVYKRQLIRGYSGANWSVRTLKGEVAMGDENICRKKTIFFWDSVPHPGQALEAVPWISRSVAIDYYDSMPTSGFSCVRDHPKKEREDAAKSEKQVPETKAKSRWSSTLSAIIADFQFRKELVTRYDMDARQRRWFWT